MENIFDFDSEYQELLIDDHIAQEDEQKTLTENYEHNQEKQSDLELFSVFLNCQGDSIVSNGSTLKKDLHILFIHQTFEIPEEVEIFDFAFDEDFRNYDLLLQMARTNIHKISLSSIDSNNQSNQRTFYSLRESVTKLLLILRCNYYQDLSESQLNVLRISLGTFDSMTNFSLVHSSYSADGNSSLSSTYHLLHGMLEWRWIYLTLIYKVEFMHGRIGNEDSDLACEVKLLMYDLVTLSIAKYQKCTNANVFLTSPFICGCVKEMWTLIYEFIERLQDNSINFWSLLANVILDEVKNGRNFYENFPSKRVLLRSSQLISLRNSYDQFSIWFMSGLIKMMLGGNESCEYFETLIKNYLRSDQSEENLRVLMLLITETILTVWAPKSEILMLLWEVNHKKINSPFLIAGQSPNFMQVSNNSAETILDQLRKQQAMPINKINANLSSFTMFTYAIGKMVEKFTNDNQKIQVQKILGRILSKFPAGKLQQLNEMGIHNILKLLFTLAMSTDFSEVAQKVTHMLLQIPLEKSNLQQQVMRAHMAMIMLYCENQINITPYITKLMIQVNVQIEKSSSNILKTLAESLPSILLRNEEIFENGEDILLDVWITKYLQHCATVEQDRLYESLSKVIGKIRAKEIENLSSIIVKMFNLLMPFLKQNFGRNDSVWLPELTGNLCLLALDTQHLSDVPKFEQLFKSILEISTTNFESSMKFITYMIKNCPHLDRLDTLSIMQNWIKFSVLLSGSNHELNQLTRCVMKIEEFQSLCETSAKQSEEFVASKEPLITFIADIGKNYAAANYQGKLALIEKIHTFFMPFEKWALPILQQSTSQKTPINVSSSEEYIRRIYTFIAITFLHCSELIYIRSKSSCFFNVAISQFILPSSLMIGQSTQQPRVIAVVMHKIWSLLIEGISRLNYKNDQHIAKVLTDVIVKWAPQLKIHTNSKFVAKAFISVSNQKDLELVDFFWEKIAKNFIALQPGKKSNASSNMMLTMVEETMHVVEEDEQRVMAIWRNTMQHVIESAMLLDEIEPAQKTCFNLFDRFLKNKHFESSISMRDLVLNNLKIITDSSLSYHSAAYFRFLNKLAKHRPKIIVDLMPHLMQQIQKVEQLRGSGRDVKLRNLYEQLQTLCRK